MLVSKTAIGLPEAEAAAAMERDTYLARNGAGIARPVRAPRNPVAVAVGRTTRAKVAASIVKILRWVCVGCAKV